MSRNPLVSLQQNWKASRLILQDLSGKIEIGDRPDKVGPNSEFYVGSYFDQSQFLLISVALADGSSR
jgi:hypothetical protein